MKNISDLIYNAQVGIVGWIEHCEIEKRNIQNEEDN